MLLDTSFAEPSVFRNLIKKANVKHVRHNYNLPREAEDEDIYNLATTENRIIVTQDQRFDKQLKIKGTGILIIPAHLFNEEIDKLLSEFISDENPETLKGKATKI